MANKLELTWYGKDEPIRVEPRLLIENPALSNTADDSETENMLIHGDNLLALKALESKYAGQVKCIYIDPPYNTGSAFEHYDDNLEHSTWLSLMKPRLEILRNLLMDDGVLFISIDDDECHYLKILCDEVFGRKNYVGSFIWEKKKKPSFLSNIGIRSEYILIYFKDKKQAGKLTYGESSVSETYPLYNASNGVKDLIFSEGSVYFPWLEEGVISHGEFVEDTSSVILVNDIQVKDYRNSNPFILNGAWRYGQDSIDQQIADGDYYIVKTKKFRPRRVFQREKKKKTVHNLLTMHHYNMSTNEDATEENRKLFAQDAFETPKPEMLLEFLLTTYTTPGDLVLDSFLGSGTTAAVAHKMGRRYIGIEMGDHAYTHCKVRLDKVISGEDQGGISKAQNWQGGGGYRFYELAPTLINKDPFDEYVINPDYDADTLAAAVALHEGFTYQPDKDMFWKQSVGSEKSYLFVTTRHINAAYLDSIQSTMEDDEYLIIACKSFDSGLDKAQGRITIKKIPQMLLSRCEFGKDNYNLNIVHAPVFEDELDEEVCDE